MFGGFSATKTCVRRRCARQRRAVFGAHATRRCARARRRPRFAALRHRSVYHRVAAAAPPAARCAPALSLTSLCPLALRPQQDSAATSRRAHQAADEQEAGGTEGAALRDRAAVRRRQARLSAHPGAAPVTSAAAPCALLAPPHLPAHTHRPAHAPRPAPAAPMRRRLRPCAHTQHRNPHAPLACLAGGGPDARGAPGVRIRDFGPVFRAAAAAPSRARESQVRRSCTRARTRS